MFARVIALFAVAAFIAAGCGCGPATPAELRVDGRNMSAFNWWRSHSIGKFSPESWRELNTALDEIRMRAMARGVSGSAAVGEAMCSEVNGRTIPEVLRLGDQAKLQRLQVVRDKLKAVINGNALVAALPDDFARAESLAEHQSEHLRQLQDVLAEIAATRKQLVAHGGSVSPDAADEAKPEMLSREQALKEFERMLQRRGEWAAQHYGDWPAKIDLDGGLLPDHYRAEFLQLQKDAGRNGHTVIAVHMRADWRVYDRVVKMPLFSESVMGNLTEADRRELQEKWALSEAEIWARKQASLESHDVTRSHMKARFKSAVEDLSPGAAPSDGLRVVTPPEPVLHMLPPVQIELPKR